MIFESLPNYFFFLFFGILGYLCGSFPTGYLVVKAKKGIDIRKVGSGAIGGTNVGRVLGKKWGYLVGLFDILKAFFPTILARRFFPQGELYHWGVAFTALMPAIGHIWPVFLNFKGGKGVACTIGSLLAIFGWKIALLAFLIFFPLILIFKISSIASLTFALSLPPFLYLFGRGITGYLILGILLSIIIFWAHRENIQRLIQGKEKRSGII